MHLIDRIFRRDFVIDNIGRVTHVVGVDNVKLALRNRFSVYPGLIPYRPQYGTLLKKYSGEPLTRELENQLEKEVRQSIERDSRVKLVRQTRITSTQDGLIQIEVEIVIVGNDSNINFQVVI